VKIKSLRDCSVRNCSIQGFIPGYSQPSLRGWFGQHNFRLAFMGFNPELFSFVPCGT
jgi:hypothetical protein